MAVAVLLAIVVSPYITILLSVADIAPLLAWLCDELLIPVKTVDWMLMSLSDCSVILNFYNLV